MTSLRTAVVFRYERRPSRLPAHTNSLVRTALVVVEDRGPDAAIPFPEFVLRAHADEGLLLPPDADQVLRLKADLQLRAWIGDRRLCLAHEGDFPVETHPEVLPTRQGFAVEAHVDGFWIDTGQAPPG